MRAPRLRCRPSARLLAAALLLAGGLAYCYYSLPNYRQKDIEMEKVMKSFHGNPKLRVLNHDNMVQKVTAAPAAAARAEEDCRPLRVSQADVDTVTVFPTFEFQPSWMRNIEFWDKSFEQRYTTIRNDSSWPTLEVIVVPHSHNDPGWLLTFEQYLEQKTTSILNNVVEKLTQYPDLTFIWSEIAFLSAWWDRAHPIKQKALKKLVQEGRLEITGGGWVMPDEACTHYYSLIDQFLEGHMWVKEKLGVGPRSGWSVDPFGHGPTVPRLLALSGFDGAVIQRIHYAWKQWLAKHQIEDFHWIPGWETAKQKLIVHNQPFDIYSIKSSCGPHPAVCLRYDFWHGGGSWDALPGGLRSAADSLIAEYARSGSLTTHNVILVPLGDDFRYEYPEEFDRQYLSYRKLFDYINSRFYKYRAHVRFGTPRDYFALVRTRLQSVPTLRGDLFVYSDIFSEGRPAYWSGYFTTRPYAKLLARTVQHHLRTAHILFTYTFNAFSEKNYVGLPEKVAKKLEKVHGQLIGASRNLGLFQHHDAITGTSKSFVMEDYGAKLVMALYASRRAQEFLLGVLLRGAGAGAGALQSVDEWDRYGHMPVKLGVTLPDRSEVIVFNSLLQPRIEVVTLPCNKARIRVRDTLTNKYVLHQINPVFIVGEDNKQTISNVTFDLLFVADLPPLTAVTYAIEEYDGEAQRSVVFCEHCDPESGPKGVAGGGRRHFDLKPLLPGDVRLENSALELLIDRNTGFLRQIYRKDSDQKNLVQIQIGAYQSAQRRSGAYLFKPDYSSPEKNILEGYSNRPNAGDVLIVSGGVATEITTLYLPLLVHTVRIYHVDEAGLARGVLVENTLDLEPPPRNRDSEVFMRLHTDLENGDPPRMHTDQNGFQYQERVAVGSLGIEANYYPVTTSAWIEDAHTRISALTAQAQGAAATVPGRLELMLERRILYDDGRGMGEGVVDNVRLRLAHWLLVEPTPTGAGSTYRTPSALAERLSRTLQFPPTAYTAERAGPPLIPRRALAARLPTGLHLVSLRTLGDSPAPTALLTLHRPAPAPVRDGACAPRHHTFPADARFEDIHISNITEVSLTGLVTHGQLNSLSDIVLEPMEIKTYQIWF